jgi:hypothetical protein
MRRAVFLLDNVVFLRPEKLNLEERELSRFETEV